MEVSSKSSNQVLKWTFCRFDFVQKLKINHFKQNVCIFSCLKNTEHTPILTPPPNLSARGNCFNFPIHRVSSSCEVKVGIELLMKEVQNSCLIVAYYGAYYAQNKECPNPYFLIYLAGGCFGGVLDVHELPSLKLTRPLKINGWKMNFLSGWLMFRGYV